ncbi:mannitol dehydrogenase family protein [Salinisphaera aquimarina]|uniref:Mannitol dehydrogenase family protein n=1 Tax=Salinisphaera aquimarina TaxID=2094031 RepID=A0ABV7EKR1_9GAMM
MTRVERIDARRTPATSGIVHLGLGAFHRAHQAVYVQQCIDAGAVDWGITSVNLRGNHALVEQLRRQGHRYHVAEYRDRGQAALREISAIRETLFTGRGAGTGDITDDLEVLLARLAAPETRIVTLTVTEKGYCLNPAAGTLNADDPAVQADLASPQAPRSVPGLLVEALWRRRVAGIAPFAVLSCDNMPDNGRRTRAAVIELARELQARGAEPMAGWIADAVAFPSSMVDRIVPAMDAKAREKLAALNRDDPAAVICEAFSQWVVEDDFPLGRPDWAPHGVTMVADVTPFETMKLRMLNGSHSLLAYVGVLAGFTTVAEAIREPAMATLIGHYMRREAAPTLATPEGVDLAQYEARLLARFGNDSLDHRLQQIAMDGSQKLPQRWLSVAGCQLFETPADTPAVDVVAFGVAAWIRYTAGRDCHGNRFTVDDPSAARLADLHTRHPQAQARVDAVLALDDIFSPALAAHAGFRDRVVAALTAIEDHGMTAALNRFAATLDRT